MSDSEEKPPYGYALMIETPLESLPQNILHAIKIPTQPIGTVINNKLNCPDLSKDQWNSSSKSLYTLYGHMIAAPGFKQGDAIQIGQIIGYVVIPLFQCPIFTLKCASVHLVPHSRIWDIMTQLLPKKTGITIATGE
jgi:hypothetical protein